MSHLPSTEKSYLKSRRCMITATAAIERAWMITLGSILSWFTAKMSGNELNFMDRKTEVLKCFMTSVKERGDTNCS